MAIRLTIESCDDNKPMMNHELDQSLITVGRSKSCHIELDHPEISRRHFIIKFVDNAYVLLDENSHHGTQLDLIKLEPLKPYTLGSMHTINVPGFSIKLFCDGQQPHLERTTVVARELLDDLLQNESRLRECPRLRSRCRSYDFKFVEEKTTFVLGTLAKADFVVDDENIAKKHLSFTRDIFGIRIIPIAGNIVTIDNKPIDEPQILISGALIRVGNLEFAFSGSDQSFEKSSETALDNVLDLPIADSLQPEEEKFLTNATTAHSPVLAIKKRSALWALDRVFFIAFITVLVGAIMVVSQLA